MDDTFQMNFFRGDQWKPFLQIKPHLVAKTALCAGSCTISFMYTRI